MNASISVIIPTFNRKHLLARTLESIFSQSLQASEIIVVDDHSTDGTLDWLKRGYQDKLICLTSKGKGPGAARNTGMSRATGKYLKFFDSDDVMTRNMLQTQYELLQNSARDFVVSPYFFAVEENGKWFPKDDVILNYNPLKSEQPIWHYMMIDGLFIPIPAILFRKELLEEVGPWREDVTAYEDWDYLFRISLREAKLLHTNACALIYRLHGGQTTGRHFSDKQRDIDKIRVLTDLFEKYIKTDQRFNSYRRFFFRNKFYQANRAMPDLKEVSDLIPSYNKFLHRLGWQWLRTRLKLGRLKTGTDWQPCHGPVASMEKINYYLSLCISGQLK